MLIIVVHRRVVMCHVYASFIWRTSSYTRPVTATERLRSSLLYKQKICPKNGAYVKVWRWCGDASHTNWYWVQLQECDGSLFAYALCTLRTLRTVYVVLRK